METVNITPNGPTGTLINNKNFTNFLTNSILSYWNITQQKDNQFFPGSQPVSIEKKDFEKLRKYTYYVSNKTNGTRFILYFIKDKHNKNQSILMNRAMQFFSVKINAFPDVYNGTIFDGELYEHNGSWRFIVHDSVVICGTKIQKLRFSERLGEIQCCVNGILGESSDLQVEVKRFYLFSDFKNFIKDEYSSSNYNHDGIIFTPETLPVISGTQYSMFKWKPRELHTFDFLCKENEGDLDILVFNMGKVIQFAKVHNSTEEGKHFIDESKKLNEYKNECILECSFADNTFTPILVRTDKTHSNSLRTVERTLFNINENIQVDDFYGVLVD